ncbi:MAG: hypothetical protein KJ017_05890 [Alphaproteobacteria bacterium]|nr:hypothetical protein [Alphaproteobacteria bacterium]
MSDICEMKRQFRTGVADDYNGVVKRWRDNLTHPEEAAINLMFILKTYLDEMQALDPNEPWFDIESLIDMVKGDKAYNTERTNYKIGCFAKALHMLGSPKEQVYKSMELWLGKTRSFYKKALELCESSEFSKDIVDSEDFIHKNSHILAGIIDSANRSPFPSHKNLIRVHRAYERLLHILAAEADSEIKIRQK